MGCEFSMENGMGYDFLLGNVGTPSTPILGKNNEESLSEESLISWKRMAKVRTITNLIPMHFLIYRCADQFINYR